MLTPISLSITNFCTQSKEEEALPKAHRFTARTNKPFPRPQSNEGLFWLASSLSAGWHISVNLHKFIHLETLLWWLLWVRVFLLKETFPRLRPLSSATLHGPVELSQWQVGVVCPLPARFAFSTRLDKVTGEAGQQQRCQDSADNQPALSAHINKTLSGWGVALWPLTPPLLPTASTKHLTATKATLHNPLLACERPRLINSSVPLRSRRVVYQYSQGNLVQINPKARSAKQGPGVNFHGNNQVTQTRK